MGFRLGGGGKLGIQMTIWGHTAEVLVSAIYSFTYRSCTHALSSPNIQVLKGTFRDHLSRSTLFQTYADFFLHIQKELYYSHQQDFWRNSPVLTKYSRSLLVISDARASEILQYSFQWRSIIHVIHAYLAHVKQPT